MNKYDFPEIKTLNDVLPHIEGVDGIIHVVKEGYSVINYVINTPEVFPNFGEGRDFTAAVRRECRGLIFNEDGVLISRPFHKFFNLGEREDHIFENVDFTEDFVIMEKLDGSMIRPIWFPNGEYRLATKMGITDVSMQAEVFVSMMGSYFKNRFERFLAACNIRKLTPIFEWCSNSNRIVLDYPEDRLVLTAIRSNVYGTYYSHEDMKRWAGEYLNDIVKCLDTSLHNILNVAKTEENEEGYIFRFKSGHMIKQKLEWYVLRHRSKDLICREKNVVEMIVNDAMDDVIPLLCNEDRARVEKYHKDFTDALVIYGNFIRERVRTAVEASNFSAKQFALVTADEYGLSSLDRTVGFKYIQNQEFDFVTFFKDYIKNNLSSGKKFEAAKSNLFPSVKFYFGENNEEIT